LAALLAGAAYFTGLIVVNLHLRQFGVGILGFFAQEYVTAGIWVFLPAVPGIISGVLAYDLLDSGQFSKWNLKDRITVSLALTVGVLLAWYLLFSMVLPLFGMPGGIQNHRYWYLLTLFAALGTFGWRSLTELKEKVALIHLNWALLLKRSFAAVVITGTVAPYLQFFATKLYPSIPARWGGGKPVDARIVFAEPTTLGLPPEARDWVKVVLVTRDAVVFILPSTDGNHTYLIERSSISALEMKTPNGKPPKFP